MDVIERFWSKVEKTETCWLWKAGKNKEGYGLFQPKHGHQVYVHIFSYELENGIVPNGLDLHHKCDNRHCLFPSHLEPLTKIQHAQVSPNHPRNRTHCPMGHEYNEKNTIINTKPDGSQKRRCRVCVSRVNRECGKRRAELKHRISCPRCGRLRMSMMVVSRSPGKFYWICGSCFFHHIRTEAKRKALEAIATKPVEEQVKLKRVK